jgi:O-antigen biosynthesis protein
VTRGAGRSRAGSEAPVSPRPPYHDSAFPSVSVVIATRGRPALLKRCLDGVARQDVAPLEVLVVDNSQGERVTRELALGCGARYIIEPLRGLSCARNRGARESAGEVVAYLDDDSVPEHDWLKALLPEFLDPWVGAVAGRILAFNPDSAVDASAAEKVNFGGSESIVFDLDSPDWFERANFGGIGEGPNLAIRRSVFATWPGFDERLGRGTPVGMIGMEEHYAFFSLIDHGYRVVYTPAARVRHPFPRTEGELRARHLTQLKAAGFHLTRLFVEEPRYRRAALGYAFQALLGRKRQWRTDLGPPRPRIARSAVLLAQLTGLFLYVLDRIGGSMGPHSPRARSES